MFYFMFLFFQTEGAALKAAVSVTGIQTQGGVVQLVGKAVLMLGHLRAVGSAVKAQRVTQFSHYRENRTGKLTLSSGKK